MKVVLFCGGQGMRLREYAETIPKPMIGIGYQPMLWHIMKYFAYHGHTDFILCLGYRGDVIKKFFLEYNEAMSNDFVFSDGGARIDLGNSDIHDWQITFADTGLTANVGQRLRAVEKYLADDELFMATYTDGLCDVPLDKYLEFFVRHDKTASFVQVHPTQTFHVVQSDDEGLVTSIDDVKAAVKMNGGYFVFKRNIFDYLQKGEELVVEPFQRLIAEKQLIAYDYGGFYGCMDTFKDKQTLDDMFARGDTPWMLWDKD